MKAFYEPELTGFFQLTHTELSFLALFFHDLGTLLFSECFSWCQAGTGECQQLPLFRIWARLPKNLSVAQ